jgi:hypothetical protein
MPGLILYFIPDGPQMQQRGECLALCQSRKCLDACDLGRFASSFRAGMAHQKSKK